MPGSPTTPGHMSARAVAPIRVAFHTCDSVGPRDIPLYRGRNEDCSPPPAQIRACAANALGSYLECVTRNRWSGHGCSTRGEGRKCSIRRHIRSHVSRCR
jgi:hypothetical protein